MKSRLWFKRNLFLKSDVLGLCTVIYLREVDSWFWEELTWLCCWYV